MDYGRDRFVPRALRVEVADVRALRLAAEAATARAACLASSLPCGREGCPECWHRHKAAA